MSDDAEPGTPPEAHMLLAGALCWAGGYVVRCSECGATTGWRLSAHPGTGPDHVLSDDADLTCPEGHTQRHPLVYPEMVRALMAARRDGDLAGQAAAGALEAIGWRPHNRTVRHGAVIYLPWEYEPGPDEAAWPDLYWAYQGGTLPRPPALHLAGARRVPLAAVSQATTPSLSACPLNRAKHSAARFSGEVTRSRARL